MRRVLLDVTGVDLLYAYSRGLRCYTNFVSQQASASKYRERKCADTTGTVLVPWAGHFQC